MGYAFRYGYGFGSARNPLAWVMPGAVSDLDFQGNRYYRDGELINQSDFTIVSGTFDRNSDGLLVSGTDRLWLDVSMLDLEPEGTVVWDGTPGASANDLARLFLIQNGAGTDIVSAQLTSATTYRAQIQIDSDPVIAAPATSSYTKGDPISISVSWDATDLRYSANGGPVQSVSTGSVSADGLYNRLYLGNTPGGTAPIEGRIRRVTIYPNKAS